MDKNSIIGFVLIGLIMMGFFGYQSREYKKQVEAQAQIDSLARVEQAREDSIRLAWLAEHPELFHPDDLDYVHAPERMGTLKNFISINGGVQLDLMGQENAETAGTRQLSGTGGQLDFLEGAFRSEGGKGFICLASSRKTKDGELKSNIVPFIPAGSTTSAPRALIENVATEYGVAHLTGLTVRERAEAMISVAHPAFRDELRAYAEKNWK